jgi:hypothetical protein
MDGPTLKDALSLRLSTLDVINIDSLSTQAKIDENKRKIKWLEQCQTLNRTSSRALVEQIKSLSEEIDPEDLVEFRDKLKNLQSFFGSDDEDEDAEMVPVRVHLDNRSGN